VRCCLIASFYLVDRGLWRRLPADGFSRGSVGSDANGHTTVVSLLSGTQVCGVGSIGIVPIGHVAY
jgi:hypothetical protein